MIRFDVMLAPVRSIWLVGEIANGRISHLVTLGLVALTLMLAVQAGSAAPGHPNAKPNPALCNDPYADEVKICVAHEKPRPGRIFTGVLLWVLQPATTKVTGVTCDAAAGGRIYWDGGAPNVGNKSFAGGVRLAPFISRSWTRSVYADGTRHLARAICGWRIPLWASGKLLSLVHPPKDVPCDPDCPPWGFNVTYGSTIREESDTTWRIARR